MKRVYKVSIKGWAIVLNYYAEFKKGGLKPLMVEDLT